jgi:hypothetical protein
MCGTGPCLITGSCLLPLSRQAAAARGLWVSSRYSLSAPPQPGTLRSTLKSLGDHSRALPGLRGSPGKATSTQFIKGDGRRTH